MSLDESVELPAIGSNHVLHITDILQPPLNLKGGGARPDELLQMGALVHVLERQQMTLMLYLLSVGIQQVEPHTAELGAGTTVGRAPEAIL